MWDGVEDDTIQCQREDNLSVDHVDSHKGLLRLQGHGDEKLLQNRAWVSCVYKTNNTTWSGRGQQTDACTHHEKAAETAEEQ